MRVGVLFIAVVMWAAPVPASEIVLSEAGEDFGRVAVAALDGRHDIFARAQDAAIDGAFIIARNQSNRVQMLTPDSGWQPWDGDPTTLVRLPLVSQGGVMRFSIDTLPLADVFLPCTVTVGYWSSGIMKFGYLTVDGP